MLRATEFTETDSNRFFLQAHFIETNKNMVENNHKINILLNGTKLTQRIFKII